MELLARVVTGAVALFLVLLALRMAIYTYQFRKQMEESRKEHQAALKELQRQLAEFQARYNL